MRMWTTKEIQYVKKNALLAETNEVLNVAQMSKKLGRTEAAITKRITLLRQSGDLPAINRENQFDIRGRPYSAEEDKRIIAMYRSGSTLKEIGEAIERTEGSVTCRLDRLRKKGAIKTKKTSKWSQKQIDTLKELIEFDEKGFVNNYPILTREVKKNYQQVAAKISKLRKDGELLINPVPGTTSENAKRAMNKFNDARFGHVNKKEEVEKPMPQPTISPAISIESREVTLIMTTTIINGQRSDQYFTKDGQLIAKKEPTSVAAEVSQKNDLL